MTIGNHIWPLVIVGRGSSAAYYLSSINPADYAAILAIGEDDAWAGKRGHSGNASDPTLKINHPLHLIAHFKATIPGFSEQLVDRLDWARMNEEVLRGCHVAIHQAAVTEIAETRFPMQLAIQEDLGAFGFRIDLRGPDGNSSVYAYKVVVCAGTGGHRVPTELATARKSFPRQVLDLDEFAKLDGRSLTSQTRVVVIGANAAIDGVHKALNYGCKIDWLIDLDEDKKPAMLATQPRMLAAWDNPERAKLTVFRFGGYSYVDRTGDMLRLQVRPRGGATGPARYAMGNIITYGVGPDGGPTGMINNTIKAKLKPIMDGTKALKPPAAGNGIQAPEAVPATILGYEAEGTGLLKGLEIFGAMSGQVGRAIANSGDRMEVLRNQIAEFRRIHDVYFAILADGSQIGATPYFARSLDELANLQRGVLHGELQRELKTIMDKNPNSPELRSGLEALANQILAYHTAAAYAALPNDDPNSLKNFAKLLNQVTTTLPKGAVGDSGQLTSINAALGAYATMRGNMPKYMPKQHYAMPGPPPPGTKAAALPAVQVTTTPGNINFNLDNAQNLAIYLCVSFPNIPAHAANAFVDEVMAARHQSNIGFTDQQVRTYKDRLARMEREALGAATTGLSHT